MLFPRVRFSPAGLRVLLSAFFGLLAASPLSAGVILSVANPVIAGAPLDQLTLNGTLSASGVIVSLLPGNPPWQLTSSALSIVGLLTPSGLSLPDGGSYTGPIALVQITGSALPGIYPSNSFSISFDDDNGRTSFTNSVNLSADVQQSQVPEPATLFLIPVGLIAVGARRRLRGN
jgi:PEP-CTERM motif-containing protein